MTKKEWIEQNEEKLSIYRGILFHNQTFADGDSDARIQYDLSCTEFAVLREKYGLEKIAGKGSDFTRAKRLLHYLAPRLHHSSWYDNHVPCNALDLLAYSFENPEQGINCLNKSKILAECCLALGIYARRVSIMPFSPYDFDNHVVTEIYDRQLNKWIMLDATTDGYFVDENEVPLSLLEMRDKFANDAFITFVLSTSRLTDLKKLQQKYTYYNAYICKNLFYFSAERENRFGPGSSLQRQGQPDRKRKIPDQPYARGISGSYRILERASGKAGNDGRTLKNLHFRHADCTDTGEIRWMHIMPLRSAMTG